MAQFLHFSVAGEYITNLARQLFYCDHKLEKALNIIKGATQTDQLSESEHLTLCLEIISGSKKIKGIYPGDDYGVVDDNGSFNDFIKEIEKMDSELTSTKEELKDMLNKFAFVCRSLSDYELKTLNREYREEYDEFLFETSEQEKRFMDYVTNSPTTINPALQSYMDRRADTTKHTYEDYGWLEPDGTYHEVDWGCHSDWAKEYLDEHYPYTENKELYWAEDKNGDKTHFLNGDVLVYRLGWVLLDSPAQGIATPKYDSSRNMTKAQKEFLYDYYIERGLNTQANKLYED
jgi:hypothetical protein